MLLGASAVQKNGVTLGNLIKTETVTETKVKGTQNRMTPKSFPDWERVAEGRPRP